ncbi:SusC/RagA family TonB-linked outer membrane protein [Joostella atrarenae]|uniref:SusC/RagA family TonB-linked outer membrane protein n=1 Tax=Joostella atrarenae TaxID=679257 RepID=A0ABS9J0S9_9FLAO|nr:SusC/RagA family TonB-linked outer membrane protein [Joostella atrarenae]MCF8714040.1 SusC/RagA family TonB-linked outer membrane protein [Joostella atrarenae]
MRTKFSGFLTLILALIVQITFAQEKTVTGVITDQDGLPLPGASVVVKGTNNGTQTDFDGNYSIKANTGDVLTFSFVGQKTEERTVGASNSINVSLQQDAQALDEVVVTALGISKKEKALAFSAPKVDSEGLNNAQNDNAVSALSGKVAGVSVNSPSGNLGGSQRILIRGVNSVTGNNQPLFVIDGIPMDNSNFNTTDTQRGSGGVDWGSAINDINPQDIESMTVLKGAAAALYGSRAANGVILVTTKKGRNKNKLGITINTSVSFDQVAILPDLQREYGGGSNPTFETQNIEGRDYKLVEYATDESWGPKYDANTNVLHWDAFDKESFPDQYLNARPWVAPANDVESFFNTGITNSNNISIGTSGETGNYLFSFGNTSTTGTLPNTSIDKYNMKVSINQNLSDKLTASSVLNYVRTQGQRPVVGYGDNSVTQKFFQFGQRNLDYERLKDYKNIDGSQRTWNRVAWDDPTPNYSDNPYWTVYENFPTDERDRVFGNFSLNYQITDDFSVKGSVYGDVYSFKNTERAAVGSQAQSYYLERNYNFYEFNYEFIANYQKRLSDLIEITALAGANKRDSKKTYIGVSTTGGLSIPGIYNINNGLGPIDNQPNGLPAYTSVRKTNSVFGSFGVSIADQLFLDFTARNDWSSTLPDDNNSYFYPSASAAWSFSEAFSDNSSWFGKLRFGWAQIGNDTDPYRVVTTMLIQNPFDGNGRVTLPNTRLNPDLMSETTETWEIGTELSFFNRRVNLDFTYYNNKTTDQIIPVDLSYATGYGAKWINSGEMSNKGIEVGLGLTPVRNDNFSWDINLNFAKNENELVELADGLETLLLSNAPFRAQLVAFAGQQYGTIMGTDFIYDDQGNKVINSDGTYAATNGLVNLGSVLPEWTAGLNNTFRYKNLDLSFLIDVRQGGKYYSTSHQWGMYSGMLQETVDNNIREDGIVLDGVTGDVTYNADGTYEVSNTSENTTNISGYSYGKMHYGTVDALNVFDADYFKLREMTLGYTFKGDQIPAFDNLRLSIFGRNLYTWGLDYDGIDPETTSAGSGNIQGLEGGLQPSTRSYGMSLQVSF